MENDPFFDCDISLSQFQPDHAVSGTACSMEEYTGGDTNMPPICVSMVDDNWEETFISQLKDSEDVLVDESEEIGDEEMEKETTIKTF